MINEFIIFLQNSPTLFLTLIGIFCALVGSFLNVVIYRLPKMIENTYREECEQFLQITATMQEKSPFNLSLPASHCPKCHQPIKAWQNIPLISYLFLRGKCYHCKTKIPWRYPLVELLTILLGIVIALKFGVSVLMLAALLFTFGLLVLFFIDLDTQLLPDSITLPLLWLGLLINQFTAAFALPQDALLGAVLGYLTFWLITQAFKLCSGKTAMGNGDFKLLAMCGAWLGWQALPFIVLISASLGTLVGCSLILLKKQDRHTPIAFGPYLAIAGFLSLLGGHVWFMQWLKLL